MARIHEIIEEAGPYRLRRDGELSGCGNASQRSIGLSNGLASMNSRDDARYPLTLAKGYLDKAERFYGGASWHDCVRDAQAAVENAGKAIVACFMPVEKTYQPAEQIRVLLDEGVIPGPARVMVVETLHALEALGWKEYIQATYGDEATFTLP